ncbi:hypothetical protein PTT_20349 [Pyrenophora teres f. teres 0-1]|uniref:Uncharacterized protein n=1 Tax=Pyrenophora teres f. teres (strain 0-1) TaxID=861557 RepID=E3SAX3_PYRTT|nr:hypothetical protein PTT_20349 [Pyrenophora teres f. teres 0-1]
MVYCYSHIHKTGKKEYKVCWRRSVISKDIKYLASSHMLGGHDRTKGLLEMLDTGKWIRDKLNLLTKRYLGFSDEAEVRAFQEELDRGCLELDYIARLGKEANQLAIQALPNPKDRRLF